MFFFPPAGSEGSCISQAIGKFPSWESLRLLSAGGGWEAGAGVSHVGKLCESLHLPLPWELSRHSPHPCAAASCQSEMVQQWVSQAVFRPKFNRITTQLLQPVPEAGCHQQLTDGILSPWQTALLQLAGSWGSPCRSHKYSSLSPWNSSSPSSDFLTKHLKFQAQQPHKVLQLTFKWNSRYLSLM